MMNFTIDVRLTASPELLSAIQDITTVFTGQMPPAKQAKQVVEKPVQEAEAVKVTVKAEEPKKEVQAETTSETTNKDTVSFTIEQVRAAVKDKATNGKKDQVKALLAEFDTTSVTNMDVKHYAAFMAKVEAL